MLWVFIVQFRHELLGDGSIWPHKCKETLVAIELKVGVQISSGIRISSIRQTRGGEDNTVFIGSYNRTIWKLPFGDVGNVIGERPTSKNGIRQTGIIEFNPVRFPSITIEKRPIIDCKELGDTRFQSLVVYKNFYTGGRLPIFVGRMQGVDTTVGRDDLSSPLTCCSDEVDIAWMRRDFQHLRALGRP